MSVIDFYNTGSWSTTENPFNVATITVLLVTIYRKLLLLFLKYYLIENNMIWKGWKSRGVWARTSFVPRHSPEDQRMPSKSLLSLCKVSHISKQKFTFYMQGKSHH
jgi:hypothetical protein